MNDLEFIFPPWNTVQKNWIGVNLPVHQINGRLVTKIENWTEMNRWLSANTRAAHSLQTGAAYQVSENGRVFAGSVYRVMFRSRRDAVLFKLSLV